MAVCCCELTKQKYRQRSATLSLLYCGMSHIVFLMICSVSVSTHHVSSYILVRLRLAYFDYEHELAFPDLQVSCCSETGIFAGYKHDEGMKKILESNTLRLRNKVQMRCEHYYGRKEKHYCHQSHQAVLLVLTVQMKCEHYYWRKEKHYCHQSHQAVLLVLTVQIKC